MYFACLKQRCCQIVQSMARVTDSLPTFGLACDRHTQQTTQSVISNSWSVSTDWRGSESICVTCAAFVFYGSVFGLAEMRIPGDAWERSHHFIFIR